LRFDDRDAIVGADVQDLLLRVRGQAKFRANVALVRISCLINFPSLVTSGAAGLSRSAKYNRSVVGHADGAPRC